MELRAFLAAGVAPVTDLAAPPLRVVDLFAGLGGLSVGAARAAAGAGLRLDVTLAVDAELEMVRAFRRNVPGSRVLCANVSTLFPGGPGTPLDGRAVERLSASDAPDLLVAGPPCQGHSDLNNVSRRDDWRNGAYRWVARAAEYLQPSALIVENVPAVTHARGDVVGGTVADLRRQGYTVAQALVRLDQVGLAQTRRRHVLVAVLGGGTPGRSLEGCDLDALLEPLARPNPRPASLRDAIGDIVRVDGTTDPWHVPSVLSAENERRLAYLRENGVYDLPDSRRPACHSDKPHSYKSAYGRLSWDKPSQTITSGFASPGQGRYVHPDAWRTLTPREAMRIQGLPDWYDLGQVSRSKAATMIGNAVPPALSWYLVSALLGLWERQGGRPVRQGPPGRTVDPAAVHVHRSARGRVAVRPTPARV